MYLSYEEYQLEMCGTLPPEVFHRLAFKAKKAVDAATFGRVSSEEPVREAIKRLVFELVSLYALSDGNEGSAVSSVSADGYSESYAVPTETEKRQREEELIRLYLSDEQTESGTPLLYLGVS